MKKRRLLICVLLCALVLASAFAVSAEEHTGTCGDGLTWRFDSQTGLLTISGEGNMYDYDTYNSPPWQDLEVLNVLIGEGVTSIGSRAFALCYYVQSITIPATVSSVGDAAFYQCSSLQELTIPAGVKVIGRSCFSKCSSLKTVHLPMGLQTIGDGAFDWCRNLEEMVIPEGVTYIGESAFSSSNKLRVLWLPSTLQKIGDHAFSAHQTIWHVMYAGTQDQWDQIEIGIVNDSLLGATRHTQCTGNESIDPEHEICTLCPADPYHACGEHATWSFDEKTGTLTISGWGHMYDGYPQWYDFRFDIKTVVVEEGITKIGDYSFCDMDSCTSISLPSTLTAIGEYGIANCDLLLKIDIPDSVTSLGVGAFRWSQFAELPYMPGVKELPQEAFAECNRMTKVIIPANIESYGLLAVSGDHLGVIEFQGDAPVFSPGAFQSQTVTVIYLADNPTWKGGVFDQYQGTVIWIAGEVSAEKQTFGSANFTWWFEDGTLYISGDGFMDGWSGFDGAPWYRLNGVIEHVVISGNVQNIYSTAFFEFKNLRSVTIPDTVTDIMEYAFYGCVSLEKIDLPDSLKMIDRFAFLGCEKLTEVEIPADINYLVSKSFSGCDSLQEVRFKGNMPYFGENVFTSPQLHIYYPAANRMWKKTEIEKLPGKAVPKDTVFTAEGDPSSPESDNQGICGPDIQWKFENGCLTFVGTGEMPDPLDENFIPWIHLQSKIKEVVIGEGITGICFKAFYECKNLEKVTLPTTLKLIGGQAFRDCTKLQSVQLPDGLEYIGDFSFMDCKKLQTIVIPASVRTVFTNAFKNCKAMKTVYFEGSAPDMDYPFLNMTATVYYPINESSWNGSTMKQYGGKLTWVEYCANRHDFGEWIMLEEATYEKPGLQERVCAVCGEKEQQEIPMLQPTQPPTVPTEPTEPATKPTTPEMQPTQPTAPSVQPTEPADETKPDDDSTGFIIGICAAVLAGGGIVAILVLKRKK